MSLRAGLVLAGAIASAVTGSASAQVAPPAETPTDPVLVPETPAPPPPLDDTAVASVEPAPADGALTAQPPVVAIPEGEAPPREPDPEHRGFFVRGMPGGGYLELSREGLSGKGIALGIGIQVGYAIIENLILFGELWYRGVSNAQGEGITPATSVTSTTLNALAGGVGLAYYFMPINLHLALAFNVVYGEILWDETFVDGRVGYGGRFLLGKEWYVARQLGLGIAADVALAGLEEYVLFGAGLLGTVTFN